MVMRALLAVGLAQFPTSAALAEGDPTIRAERLEPLLLDAESGFSQRRYEVETGVYYRWRIRSDGLEEYKLVAPDFFPQIWVDQVVIENREVKPAGLYAVEFDDRGEIDIWFVPIRPGAYEFYVEGLRDLGFLGTFEVR